MFLGSAEKPERLYLGGAEPIVQTRLSDFQHAVDSRCLSDHSYFLLNSKLSFCWIYLFAVNMLKRHKMLWGRGHSFTMRYLIRIMTSMAVDTLHFAQ